MSRLMKEEKNKQQIEFAKETIQNLLSFLSSPLSLECIESGEDFKFVVDTNDPSLLIGENGQNLYSLNLLTRRIFEKKFPQGIKFLIDVNDYHQKKIEEIKDEARIRAQRVRYFKKDIEMRPMNAYERRIVHMTLQEYPDITTESKGEGKDRCVVIKPFAMV
jgi:spoIIIJ-associated protein